MVSFLLVHFNYIASSLVFCLNKYCKQGRVSPNQNAKRFSQFILVHGETEEGSMMFLSQVFQPQVRVFNNTPDAIQVLFLTLLASQFSMLVCINKKQYKRARQHKHTHSN